VARLNLALLRRSPPEALQALERGLNRETRNTLTALPESALNESWDLLR